MKTRTILLMLLMTVASASFAGEADGPFGLVWGMTKAQVGKLGVKLVPDSAHEGIEIFKTMSLPKNLSIAESYTLTFDKKYHLQQVSMLSKDIDGDIYGIKGKEKFCRTQRELSQEIWPADKWG